MTSIRNTLILIPALVCSLGSSCLGQTIEEALKADSLSRYYSDNYQFSKSIECLETAVPIYEEHSCLARLADARYRLGDMYCMKGQYHLTLSNTVEALKIYEQEKDTLNIDKDELKMVLAMVLRDLKREDRCYVKHERRQGCFHITVKDGE